MAPGISALRNRADSPRVLREVRSDDLSRTHLDPSVSVVCSLPSSSFLDRPAASRSRMKQLQATSWVQFSSAFSDAFSAF